MNSLSYFLASWSGASRIIIRGSSLLCPCGGEDLIFLLLNETLAGSYEAAIFAHVRFIETGVALGISGADT